MRNQPRASLRLLFFLSFVILVISHNVAFSQPAPPGFKALPPGIIPVQISLTEGMLAKNYFYGAYYVSNREFPLRMVFYDRRTQENVLLNRYPDQIKQIDYNKFYVMGSWSQLKRPGDYLITFISYQASAPAQRVIQTLKVSSNTKKAIEDKHTLIVNNSVGVAPERGSDGFKIRYELNETSKMTHKIEQYKDNRTMMTEDKDDVPKGTQGFDWIAEDAKNHYWYRAVVKAVSVTDKDKWDHDVSRRFQKIK